MFLKNLNLFQDALDYMQEGVVLHTPDTQIAFANKAAAKLLDLSQEELQTKSAHNTDWEFVDENENTLTLEKFPVNIALDTKKSFNNYIIGRKSADQIKWFQVNGELIYNGDSLDYILITFSDVTQFKQTQDQLELYKYMVEHADTGITVADIRKKDNPLVYVNPMFEKISGYDKEEILGTNCRFLQGKDRQQEGRFIIKDALKNKISCEVELKNYKKDGTLFYNLLNLTPLVTKDKKLKYYIGIQHDITKLKNLEYQFKKLINTQDNIVIVSNGKSLDFANNKFFKFFGYKDIDSFKEQQNCICDLFLNSERFFHKAQVKDGETWIEGILKLQHSKRVVSMMSSNFNVHAFSVSLSQFDEENYIVTFTNISQTMLENIKLLEKTLRDKLTGALNREYFDKNYKRLIQEYTENGNHLAIAVIDIDHFKLVNDTYGHDVGDQVLISFVKTIKKFSREKDILIRWGGEEFIVILQVNSEDDLIKALEHMRKVIELESFPTVGQKTCSIGGTLYQDGENINQTIKRADEGVYEAKAAGRNIVILK